MKTLNTKHKYYVSTYIIQKCNLSIYNHTAIFLYQIPRNAFWDSLFCKGCTQCYVYFWLKQGIIKLPTFWNSLWVMTQMVPAGTEHV